MSALNVRAMAGLLQLLIIMAAIIFLPAWTLDYWQAWIFLAVFFVSVLAITIYLMKNDPKLLERRTNAGPGYEHQTSQNIIQSLAAIAFIAMFLVSALDHRFGWASVPPYGSLIGDVLVALGLYFVFLVFK